MSSRISIFALSLFVINLGIVFGAGLYEARIEFPQWLVNSPGAEPYWDAAKAREANTGIRFWVFASTITLTLLTLLILTLAIVRKWWLTAAVVALADRVFTFTYFIPTMITLMQDESLSGADAVGMASLWGNLNHLRHLLVLVAWIAALKAFRHYQSKRRPVSQEVITAR